MLLLYTKAIAALTQFRDFYINKLGLSWAKLSQGLGYSFDEVKISQELTYKCFFDFYLRVASNFCVRSSAELSVSVGLKLAEVNHSYLKKKKFSYPTIIISVFAYYLTILVAERRSTKFFVSTTMDN